MFYDIWRIMKGSSIRREQVPFCHRSMDIFAPFDVALPSSARCNAAAPCRCWVSKSWPATRTASSRSWRSDSTAQCKLGPGFVDFPRAASRLAPGVVSYRARNRQQPTGFAFSCNLLWSVREITADEGGEWCKVGCYLVIKFINGVMGPQ